MPETLDFERAWLAKFASCLGEIAGEEIRVEVLESVLKGDEVCTIAIHLPVDQ
jgi:hypothetical protein